MRPSGREKFFNETIAVKVPAALKDDIEEAAKAAGMKTPQWCRQVWQSALLNTDGHREILERGQRIILAEVLAVKSLLVTFQQMNKGIPEEVLAEMTAEIERIKYSMADEAMEIDGEGEDDGDAGPKDVSGDR